MACPVEFDQVQGIVRFGYRKLTDCSFLLLQVQDAALARQWLASAPVSSAVALPDAPQTALQVALTYDGLQHLGCAPQLLAQFSNEFQSGMALPARARLLGDTSSSAPEHWAWGTGENAVHLLLMLYARPGGLAAWKTEVQTSTWSEAFHVVTELTTSDFDGVEPFGFPDGISQPDVDWERRRVPPAIEDTYKNQIALGEFLLGYPNEYDRYTARPLAPADAEPLPPADEDAAKRDFGRNGTYLVLRTLEQDVECFQQFLRSQSASDEAANTLGAAMVGRLPDGTPLAAGSVAGGAATDPLNGFDFSADPDGTRCPLGAHIRRVNPRNGDLPSPPVTGLRRVLTLLGLEPKTLHSDAKASARFHRVLRRGREYGPPPSGPSLSPRGLHFVCLAANIARQFEFLQSAWVNSSKFDSMTGESDPLLGSRDPLPDGTATDAFTVPAQDAAARAVCGVPRFVHVRGGAYFFLPSLPALRYLAAASPAVDHMR